MSRTPKIGARAVVPPQFMRMQWLGQTTACPVERVVGLSLQDADGVRHLLAVSVDELRAMADRIEFYRPNGCQSSSSQDRPDALQSPQDGQAHVPCAAWSAASSGEA